MCQERRIRFRSVGRSSRYHWLIKSGAWFEVSFGPLSAWWGQWVSISLSEWAFGSILLKSITVIGFLASSISIKLMCSIGTFIDIIASVIASSCINAPWSNVANVLLALINVSTSTSTFTVSWKVCLNWTSTKIKLMFCKSGRTEVDLQMKEPLVFWHSALQWQLCLIYIGHMRF